MKKDYEVNPGKENCNTTNLPLPGGGTQAGISEHR